MSSSGSSDGYARRAEQREAQRQRDIEIGTQRVRNTFANQFTPEYYNKIRQNFDDFYLPQMDRQYQDARQSLVYQLARSGLGDSSVRSNKYGELNEQMALAKQQMQVKGEDYIQQRKTDVQRAQANVLGQLQQSADAEGAARDAADAALTTSQVQGYDPLGQLFTDSTWGLATQAELERSNNARFNTGLFSNNSKSGTNVG
jgi:hypothetical protein